jgi:hypothetical protein
MKLLQSALLASIGILLLSVSARADDGGISFGGTPYLLKGHPSVSMQDEVVNIDIHKDIIKVDCKFLFHNSGPECTVRMGFPDQGLGAEEPYQGEDVPMSARVKATFLTYDSYVDGKKVPTKLVPTDDRGLYWHAKTVTFKAKSNCIIRDTYTLKPGAQVTAENGMYQQTYYILHTGASWHGPIGKAKITLNFAPDAQASPIKLQPVSKAAGSDPPHLKWSQLPVGTVLYEGPCEPKVEGQSLHFVTTNLRPALKDDIHVYYAYRKLGDIQ